MEKNYIRSAVYKRDLSAKEFAKGAKISVSTAYNLLAGKEPARKIAVRVSKYLHLPLGKVAPELARRIGTEK